MLFIENIRHHNENYCKIKLSVGNISMYEIEHFFSEAVEAYHSFILATFLFFMVFVVFFWTINNNTIYWAYKIGNDYVIFVGFLLFCRFFCYFHPRRPSDIVLWYRSFLAVVG